jgi:hypothetical protein
MRQRNPLAVRSISRRVTDRCLTATRRAAVARGRNQMPIAADTWAEVLYVRRRLCSTGQLARRKLGILQPVTGVPHASAALRWCRWPSRSPRRMSVNS